MRNLKGLLPLLLLAVLVVAGVAHAAYSGTSSVDRSTPGRTIYLVTLTETEAAAGSEATITGLPVKGTILSYKATLTAGTGTTIDPVIGRAAAFTVSTQNHIASNDAAAAHVHNQDPVRYYSSTGTLYIRSTPNNATADHSITTEILIADGWE
jgi:hypothetical protein